METINHTLHAPSDFMPPLAVTVRYCLYARKSTEQDELQALSIDSQIKEMTEAAQKEGLDIVAIRKESHSAKESGQRPVFQEVVADIKVGKFTGIIAWDPSRISRNAGDLGAIVDLMDSRRLIDIRTHGQRFTNSPNDKFMLMILCSQAKLENDHKGENVKRGLRAKCEMGYRPGASPLGYLHDKEAVKGSKRIVVDQERAAVVKQMFEKVAYEDWSGRDLYAWFVEIGLTTRKGKHVALSGIFRMLKDTFYYGEFEYPVGSGKWYKGGYDPIIDKELFLKAQANLIAPPRRRPGTFEFDFTKLFYCGNCGSGITAQEKLKKLISGDTNRYVYYHCVRFKDHHCPEKPIREEDLLDQLLQFIDKVDIDDIEIQEKIQEGINQYRKFFYSVLGQQTGFDKKPIEADVRNYARYVLLNGSKAEKRDLLSCLRSRLEIKNKQISLRIGAVSED